MPEIEITLYSNGKGLVRFMHNDNLVRLREASWSVQVRGALSPWLHLQTWLQFRNDHSHASKKNM